MKTIKVTLIIPVYKVEQYLHRCIDSVLAQTYTNLNIILVNDGSPDNCPKICDFYASQDDRIVVIHKENGGLSSARNAGLDSHHDGDFIFFCDSDDFIHPRAIELLLKIHSETGADIVQSQFLTGSENSFPEINFREGVKLYDNTSIFYSSQLTISLCGILYRTNLWDNVRMPLGKVNEDDATSWRLYFKANTIAVTKMQLYYYYKNPNSIMASQRKNPKLDFIEHYHERIDFFQNRDLTLHTQLSQWRYMLALMLTSIRNKGVTTEQIDLLWKEYKENFNSVLLCSKVPIYHRFLFVLYRCFPQTCRFFGHRLL